MKFISAKEGMFYRAFICQSVCLSVRSIIQEGVDEFWRYVLEVCWLDFGGDSPHVTFWLLSGSAEVFALRFTLWLLEI